MPLKYLVAVNIKQNKMVAARRRRSVTVTPKIKCVDY